MLIDWSDEYSIGIYRIDEQHKFFFEAVHRLYQECLSGEGEHIILETLMFMQNYAIGHFQSEEALMREHEYPRTEEHANLHAGFLDEYSKLMEEFDELGPSQDLAERTGEMVQDWLVDHIAIADMAYARHIMERS